MGTRYKQDKYSKFVDEIIKGWGFDEQFIAENVRPKTGWLYPEYKVSNDALKYVMENAEDSIPSGTYTFEHSELKIPAIWHALIITILSNGEIPPPCVITSKGKPLKYISLAAYHFGCHLVHVDKDTMVRVLSESKMNTEMCNETKKLIDVMMSKYCDLVNTIHKYLKENPREN